METLKITRADVKDGKYVQGVVDFQGNVEIEEGLGYVFFASAGIARLFFSSLKNWCSISRRSIARRLRKERRLMAVIVNIRPSKNIPARQQKAWKEFLDMLMERAEAEINNEKAGLVTNMASPAEGSED